MAQRWLKVFFCSLFTVPCSLLLSQGGAITGQVITSFGYPAANVPVRVCPYSSTGNPCTPLADIYSDPFLNNQIGNPTATDNYGNYSVFVGFGYYVVQITPSAGITYSYLVFSSGTASVYSVGLTMPSIFTVANSPITTGGVIGVTLNTETAKTFFAGPVSGGAAAPTFRALALTDLPAMTANTVLGALTATTPSDLALPSCSGTVSALDWTSGTGFGCNTFNFTGDASNSGTLTLTLATVNTNTGSFGSSTAIPNFTVNGKGLITAAGSSAVIAPAGTLTGTTLASNVVTSSLTSVGTLTSVTVSGNAALTAIGSSSNPLCTTTGGVITNAGCASVPLVVTQLNCLSVSCAGGSTYALGNTYTNSSGVPVLEEVTAGYTTYSATGCDESLVSVINGLQGPINGTHNACGARFSVTFLVPIGGTFSATLVSDNGNSYPYVVINWLELSL